ncbi:bromodomain-containing protein [Euroglyphus maynei]|uniref:Bromodomain-containing protein n=1 Tax=Euroglyphus maynei TaxID=6958 RepID=A0A1Y3BE23_EURMA|nr:bromodomain-containing protein [Euroglyphus maynei]
MTENNFNHHSSHATSIFADSFNVASHDDDMIEEISMKNYDDNIDDEIKFITEELIENVIDKAHDDDDEWRSIQIDFDGETILPNGIRLIKGVAEMVFYREDESNIPPPRFTNQLNFLKTILTKYICRYKTAVPFLNPVDSVRLKIPHYYLVIRKPMDLNTVKNRLNFLWYQSANECISDIRQIFKNCYQFNSPKDYVYSAGKKLEEFFDEKLTDMPPVEEEIPCPPKQSIEECISKIE